MRSAEVRHFRRVRLSSFIWDDLKGERYRGCIEPAVFPAVLRKLFRRALYMMLIGNVLAALCWANVQTILSFEGEAPERYYALASLTGLPAALLGLGGLYSFVRWSRRLETVNWRRGNALLSEPAGTVCVDVTFFDDGEQARYVICGPGGFGKEAPTNVMDVDRTVVWIGGTGKAITAVFAYGPFVAAVKPFARATSS